MGKIEFVSAICGSKGMTAWKHKKFCSDTCRNRNFYPERLNTDLSTATVGALGELAVSCELLRRGWTVFRALSPSAFCDLIAIKDGTMLRIEVRTAYRPASGHDRLLFNRKKHGEIDHFGLLVNDSEVIFEPPIPNL